MGLGPGVGEVVEFRIYVFNGCIALRAPFLRFIELHVRQG